MLSAGFQAFPKTGEGLLGRAETVTVPAQALLLGGDRRLFSEFFAIPVD